MKVHRCFRKNVRPQKRGEEGVALITVLLLLLLLSALSISMVVSNSSDTLINGYNRSYRAAFYSADAGNTIVRENIRASLFALLNPTVLAIGQYPRQAANISGIVSTVNSVFGTWTAVNSTGSYAESFKLYTNDTALTLYECDVYYYTDATLTTKAGPDTAVAAALSSNATCPAHAYAYQFTYTYHYNLTTVGKAGNAGGTAVTDSGNIIVNAISQDTVNSFSQYGTFIDKSTLCQATLVGGKITGRQFTNGSWNFGYNYSYIFTDAVGSQGAQAGYIFSDGSCSQVAGPSATHSRVTISPTFQKGLLLGQAAIALPTNSNNQQAAVITGAGTTADGSSANAPTSTQLSSTLANGIPATGYPYGKKSYTSSTTSGVFVPVDATGQNIVGGGLWIEGAATITLSYSGSTSQVYTITQGSTTTTVTITPGTSIGSGTTTVKVGSNAAVTYNNVPTETDPYTGAVRDAAVVYVDGNVTSLTGTIQDNTDVTITSANDITVSGNLVYKTPVYDANGNLTTGTQALGLYTAGGSIYLKPSSNGGNMEVDASILTTKDNNGDCNYGDAVCDGVLGVVNGYTIGTLTIVGGRVQSRAMIMPSGTINQRNVIFDQRYNGSFAPPFFPRPSMIINPPNYTTTIQRTGWVLRTAY